MGRREKASELEREQILLCERKLLLYFYTVTLLNVGVGVCCEHSVICYYQVMVSHAAFGKPSLHEGTNMAKEDILYAVVFSEW